MSKSTLILLIIPIASIDYPYYKSLYVISVSRSRLAGPELYLVEGQRHLIAKKIFLGY